LGAGGSTRWMVRLGSLADISQRMRWIQVSIWLSVYEYTP